MKAKILPDFQICIRVALNNSYPEFMWSYFTFKNITHNIRNEPLLKLPKAKSTYYGINSVHFRACLFWNGLPQSVKHNESILQLKRKLKELKILTVLVFYVGEIINKIFIAFCWFLLAFAICKHQR